MKTWKLIYTITNKPVREGDLVESRTQNFKVAPGIGRPPQHAGSTGRIWVQDLKTSEPIGSIEFFPSVFDAQWREIEES